MMPYAGAAALALLMSPCAFAAEPITVMAALQPTYSIAAALAEGTSIEVVVPDAPLTLAGLARAFARPDGETEARLAGVDAVITIGSVWPEDPLFLAARARNIRVVEIDATSAIAPLPQSVALIAAPVNDAPWREPGLATGEPSPYVWLSPANGIRMAEIIAADLERLAPEDAPLIAANLDGFAAEMHALKAEFEPRFLAVDEPQLFALSDRFAYLTNEFGFFVEGYFLEQDVRWSEEDHAGFAALLAGGGVTHVLHQWAPDPAIAEAITATGVDLVILEEAAVEAPADPRGYQAMLRHHLETLLLAFGG